jgi:cytochrome b subunit of formate dehydrogenase
VNVVELVTEILNGLFWALKGLCSLALVMAVVRGAESFGKEYADKHHGDEHQKKSAFSIGMVMLVLSVIGVILWLTGWAPFGPVSYRDSNY